MSQTDFTAVTAVVMLVVAFLTCGAQQGFALGWFVCATACVAASLNDRWPPSV